MKVTDISLYEVHGHWIPPAALTPSQPPGDRQAHMLDIYPEFNAQDWARERHAGPQEILAIYLEVHTDAGVSGIFGPIEEYQAFVIGKFLRPFLIGRDPLATEMLYDQMLRLHRHGRSGMFMAGISPVDCALWDLKGKMWAQPIYRLLGGPTRPAIPAYASMLGFSVEPEAAAATACEYKAQGFAAQKWFFRYGPADGEAGKARNVALVRALREELGPHYTLMFDAFMGWGATYAAEMLRALQPFNLAWLEEPIPPERVGAFRRLKAAARVPIATGEHVYARWQVKELLVNEAVDVIQTDPDWTGGVTELVKICALASAFETPVVAHGHSLLAALHVAGAQPPDTVPMVEYLIQHQAYKQFFHKPIYEVENGQVRLPVLPGLGLVLDEDKIEKREQVSF
jgi:L-alanine-DL-glutamate epimerase-like enolase superfamily enzyme